MTRMLALRYVYVLALVVWLGGMVVLGALVAPTTFQVLQASEPVTGRALAGDLFGAILARFHYVAYAAGGLLLVTLAVMAVLGPRPRGLRVRSAHHRGHAGRGGLLRLRRAAARRRDSARGRPPPLAAARGRRAPHRFDALHLLSTRLMMFNMVGALVLLYWEARET